MPRLVFRHVDGGVTTCLAEAGGSLLDAARQAGIDDIGGWCGGIGACLHCIVRIDPAGLAAVAPPGETEAAMLRLVGDARDGGLRLACQLPLSEALAGLTVHLRPLG